MNISRSLIAGLGLATALVAQGSSSERAAEFLRDVGKFGIDKQVVFAIDRLWPGDAIHKVSLAEFRTAWEPIAESHGLSAKDAGATFRLFQDFANGIEPNLNRHFASTAPVPAWGRVPDENRPPRIGTDAIVNESEPNDDFATANPFAIGDSIIGCTNASSENDNFVFTLAAPTRVDIEATALVGGACAAPHTDTSLRLYDSTENQIAFSDDFSGVDPRIQISLTPGTYYLRLDPVGTTATGDYEILTSGSAPVILDCSSTSAMGSIPSAGEVYDLLLAAPADGTYRIDVSTTSIGSALDAEIDLLDMDLETVIASSSEAAMTGEATLTAGLVAGIHRVAINGLGGTTGNLQVDITCLGALPSIVCGGTTVNVDVSSTVTPLVALNVGPLSRFDVTLTDTGIPDATDIRILDSTGEQTVSDLSFVDPSGTTTDTISSFGNGTNYARLIADPSSGASTTWRDGMVAEQWCRPTPSVGPYLGPTQLSQNSGSFTFVDDHLTAGGILTVRKFREFDIDGGSWDCGTFIDEMYVDVTTASGTTRFNPVAVRLIAPNASGFSATGTNGVMADMATDDGTYFAVNLANASNTVIDTYSIEVDFDLSSLAITGSQITQLDFFAEWYFGGNSSGTTTSSPPTFDDSSEEQNLYRDDIELLRHTATGWDAFGDALMGTYTYFVPPVPNPTVSLDLSCTPLSPTDELSAEDLLDSSITAMNPTDVFSFTTGTGGDFTFFTRSPFVGGDEWDTSSYGSAWGGDTASYPGPIVQTNNGTLPAGAVGPGGTMRLRLRKDNCWDIDDLWDDYWSFDIAELGIDTGSGRTAFYPVAATGGGDVNRFTGTSSGVDWVASETNANDGVYGGLRLDDYDGITFGASASYWLEFDYDVSSVLSAGQGNLITTADILWEVFIEGDGWDSISTTSGNPSEEIAIVDMGVEVWDFTNMTWVDLDPTPIIDPLQYNSPPNCLAFGPQMDTEIWILDSTTGALLGNDDDSGDGNFSREPVALGTFMSGQTAIVVVAASDFVAAGNETGPYQIGVEAPNGYAGTAPFEVSLSASGEFFTTARGNPGDLVATLHSVLPNFSTGVPIFLPDFDGLLLLDPSGYVLTNPNGAVVPAGGQFVLGPVVVPPSAVGVTIWSQTARIDMSTMRFVLSNGDSITVVP